MLKQPSLEEAQEALLHRIEPLARETVPLPEAMGRVLAADILAPHDLPSHPLAALDGFALPEKGVKGARFMIKKYLEPGEIPSFTLGPAEAAGVVTGGHIPPGTKEVVRQEAVRVEGEFVVIREETGGKNNIRAAGEDFRAGAEIARHGTRITPGLIAALAAFGIAAVDVHRRPRVLILNLGKEVVPHAGEASPGQVRDSNGPLLAALVKRDGGETVAVATTGATGLAGPEPLLENMLRQADLVITVGGTASGNNDRALRVLRALEARLIFWGVQIKPGSHSGAAEKDNRVVISLSGNPSACAVGYELLAAPVLRKLQGLNPHPIRLPAVCANSFKKTGQRRFLWGYITGNHDGLVVTVLPGQKSSMLQSFVKGNALIDLPAWHPPLEPGARVSVIPLNPLF
ncbi:MAG TPA: molybdopterin molybdotransferase MoeA [Syntrophomonadaceae bacterium]|nr:molybdopterin molybdotransferase MoeA [Syntrophomonadaceae bacterium]